jgi:hypothetical protein
VSAAAEVVAERVVPRHPAAFNRKALAAADKRLTERFGTAPAKVCDPFCGVGRVHELRARGWVTYGGELESEWAASSPYTIVADALHYPAADGFFDAICTSPAWGNRLADSHDAQERCSACGGEGTIERFAIPHEVDNGYELGIAFDPCPKCAGAGRREYVRNTYRHALGRPLTHGSTSGMQFGKRYCWFHADWLVEARRLVKPGGLLIVNVGNHIRAGREIDVVGWWLTVVLHAGFLVRAVDKVPAGKLRHGANHELRVDGEVNICCEVPT